MATTRKQRQIRGQALPMCLVLLGLSGAGAFSVHCRTSGFRGLGFRVLIRI